MSYNEKKFLDYNGLVHLLGKFDDYPTNDILGTVINSIDTALAGKVDDVQIDGTSIISNGTANIPLASADNYGVVKTDAGRGVYVPSGTKILSINPASSAEIKTGTTAYKPLTSTRQHESTFYGLAKVAGADMANSNNSVGIYTDTAKQKIQNMLGITSLLSTEESSTATAAHTANSLFMMDGKLHRVTAAIAIGDAVAVGTNCEVVKADEVFVKNTDYATINNYGIIKLKNSGGLYKYNDGIGLEWATETSIKNGTNQYLPIMPSTQHMSIYYGLSKLAGVDLKNETVTVGTYPEVSKAAIRSMIGAENSNDLIKVQDTQPSTAATKLWMLETAPTGVQVPTVAELEAGYVAKTDIATSTTAGIVRVATSNGVAMTNDGQIYINQASTNNVKQGTANYFPIVPSHQHEAAFYGLAKAAGDSTQASSSNAVGTYTSDASAAIRSMIGAVGDVQVNGSSIVSSGVANIPICSSDTFGVVKVDANSFGIKINENGRLYTDTPGLNEMKAGTQAYKPIVPATQHTATFYGLAKAAGDTTMASSSNAVGTYTTEAQNAIQTMLGIEKGIELIETVTGTTPTITGQPNTTYQCSEVLTLSITPPANGTIDVFFTSGSTATTLTVPSTVLFPAWFDSTALEANTLYEIMITNGTYGSVMTWQS